MHPSNILSIKPTLAVLKFDKSSDFRLLQPRNIFAILVTLVVLKLDRLSEVRF